jgi:hypothetical protein
VLFDRLPSSFLPPGANLSRWDSTDAEWVSRCWRTLSPRPSQRSAHSAMVSATRGKTRYRLPSFQVRCISVAVRPRLDAMRHFQRYFSYFELSNAAFTNKRQNGPLGSRADLKNRPGGEVSNARSAVSFALCVRCDQTQPRTSRGQGRTGPACIEAASHGMRGSHRKRPRRRQQSQGPDSSRSQAVGQSLLQSFDDLGPPV